jgi:hypothetical protein
VECSGLSRKSFKARGIFYDALNITDYIASYGRINGEGFGRKQSWLNEGNGPDMRLEERRKAAETSVRIVSVSTEIRDEHFPSTIGKR